MERNTGRVSATQKESTASNLTRTLIVICGQKTLLNDIPHNLLNVKEYVSLDVYIHCHPGHMVLVFLSNNVNYNIMSTNCRTSQEESVGN